MDFADIQNDFQEVEQDWNCPMFTWNSGSYFCLPNTMTNESKTVPIGFETKANVELIVRLNQFTNGVYPQENDPITYQGKKLNIYDIKTPAVGGIWILQCNNPDIAYKV